MEPHDVRAESRKWIEYLVRNDLPDDDVELDWTEVAASHELGMRQKGVKIGSSVRITDEELQSCIADGALKNRISRRILAWVLEVDRLLD